MLTTIPEEDPAGKTLRTETSLALGLWVLLCQKQCLVEIQLKIQVLPTSYLSIIH